MANKSEKSVSKIQTVIWMIGFFQLDWLFKADVRLSIIYDTLIKKFVFDSMMYYHFMWNNVK